MIKRSRSFHLCVTYVHTNEGVADAFIADLQDVAAALMAEPDKKCTSGMVPHVTLPMLSFHEISCHTPVTVANTPGVHFSKEWNIWLASKSKKRTLRDCAVRPNSRAFTFCQYHNRKIRHGIFFSFYLQCFLAARILMSCISFALWCRVGRYLRNGEHHPRPVHCQHHCMGIHGCHLRMQA
jgi:hypothetical protein